MKKKLVKLNPQESDGVTRRGRGTRAKRQHKAIWQIGGIEPDAVNLCKALMIGNVFHGSELGEKLKRIFADAHTSGRTLTVTVEPQP